MNDVELIAQALLKNQNQKGSDLKIERLGGLAFILTKLLAGESVTKTTNGAFNEYKIIILEVNTSTDEDATKATGQLLFFMNVDNKSLSQNFYASSSDYSKIVKFSTTLDFSANKFTYNGYYDSKGINSKGSIYICNVWGVS